MINVVLSFKFSTKLSSSVTTKTYFRFLNFKKIKSRTMKDWVKTLHPKVNSLVTECSVKGVTVVLGNEACDLDSGVSALVYANHLQAIHPSLLVLPILNIVSQDFVLKTELMYCLGEVGIGQEDLIFRDTLDLEALGDELKVVLVDHNVLADKDGALDDKVVEVIDHHAKERDGDNVIIELVGSCATLVAEKIFKDTSTKDETALDLLHKTILLDTVCLDPSARRVTPKDVKMIEAIENIIGQQDRKDIFDRIWEAKQQVNHLTPSQLLRRDLKSVSNNEKKLQVAISSVPMMAKDFIKLPGFQQDLDKFSNGKFICIIMGISIVDGIVSRDLFISSGVVGWESIGKDLMEATEPNLDLRKEGVEEEIEKLGILFSQANSAASRKQVLPLVKKSIK